MPNRQSALSTASFSRQEATVRGIEMECTHAPFADASRGSARRQLSLVLFKSSNE
jgi:hypothetical protein